MKHSMRDVCLDAETGKLDFSRGHISGGMSKAAEVKKMYKRVVQESKKKQDALFHEIELDEIARRLGAPIAQAPLRKHIAMSISLGEQ